MSRIRYLKPEFFTDADLGKIPPLARLLFQGLWCHADKEGRLKDNPQEIKVKVLPWDKVDPHKLLGSLHPKFITRYKHDGEAYIQINNFRRHQRPHSLERDSVIPPFLGSENGKKN